MGKRYEPRAETRLTVKVSGTDLDGNPFKQTAFAHNISRRGACLEGIGCLRGPGETIDIEHRGKKAKFFVAWVGLPGTPERNHIGVRNLDRNQNIWKVDLPKPEPDGFQPAHVDADVDQQESPPPQAEELQPSQTDNSNEQESTPPAALGQQVQPQESRPTGDRRRYRRYAIDGSATFQTKHTGVHTWGKLSDVSPGGCYVESYVPLPAGTELEMTLEVGGVRVLAEGIVKVVYPGLGMGIEFTKIADEDGAQLKQITAPHWK